MHFDFAYTCRTSIGVDADEVGRSVRRLLLAHARAGRRCVAFVGQAPESGFTADCAHPVEIIVVTAPAKPPFDNLRGPELAHAHALFVRLDAFLHDGHTLRLIEFPDRDAEGWFFIQHNLIRRRVPATVVRLHGGHHLLDEDNAVAAIPIADALLHVAEREVILRADHVLHSGEALRDRVLRCYTPREAAALRIRCAELVHPGVDSTSDLAPVTSPLAARVGRRLACIGPLEYRFGSDLLVLEAIRHFRARPESTLTVHCLGPDTPTANRASFLEYLRALIPVDLADRIVIDSSARTDASACNATDFDALVYPARFAAHPAQLDRAAGFPGPAFISRHGDLPAFADALPDARIFDPKSDADWAALFETVEAISTPATHPNRKPPLRAHSARSFDLTAYSNLRDTPPPALRPVPVAFVIPHLNDVINLENLIARFAAHPERDRLEVIVVDDGTPPAAFTRVEQICAANGFVTLLRTPRARSSAFTARHLALRTARSDFAAFVDADDYIEIDAYLHYASALEANPTLDALYPIQRFFGWETHDWLPGPRSRATIFGDAFNHIGILARKRVLLDAFARVGTANFHISQAEDAFHASALLYNGVQFITVPEVAYHYNRGNNASLSRSGLFRKWQSRAELRRFYEGLLAEAMREGTLPPCDLNLLRRMSLTFADSTQQEAAARGNRVHWHTHLVRALRSLAGDRRYRP